MTQRKIHRIVRRTPILYLNTVAGNDSFDGLAPSRAKQTLTAALAALPNGILRITAPSTTPVQGFVQITSGNLTLEGLNGVDWYVERCVTFTTGWASEGGGVYSRSTGGVSAEYLYVTTLLDGNGFQTVLYKNSATPSTPAAGEYGQSGGNYYVHLPGDADPNAHTIKRHNANYLFQVVGTANVKFKNCVGRYNGTSGIFQNTAPGATLILENCTGQYSGNGVIGGGGNVYATNCLMQRCINDGYNHNYATMILTDCDGSYNDDEGASPHNGSIMLVRGGHYHHNGHGGCTTVNSGTQMHLTNVLIDHNGLHDGGPLDNGGINFASGTSGSVTNCTVSNNTGPGYYCSGASVVVTNLTSTSNSQADVTC